MDNVWQESQGSTGSGKKAEHLQDRQPAGCPCWQGCAAGSSLQHSVVS